MTHSDEAYEGERESGNERDAQDIEGDPQNLADQDDQRLMGTRLSAGFGQSMLPNTNEFISRVFAPWQRQTQEQMKSLFPDMSAMTRGLVETLNMRDQLRVQVASIQASLPTFSAPVFDMRSVAGFTLNPATEGLVREIRELHSKILGDFRVSLRPLFDPDALHGLNRALLPPNLRGHAEEITANEVHEFVEQEGIPLYFVPRGRTALRLVRAKSSPARRQVLNDCYVSLIEDCAAALKSADHEAVSDEVGFALDGLGAMRAGHTRSAQAMFTVTLDTLIYRFYPDRNGRSVITNRKKGAGVPEAIDEMGVRAALVWLPVWNAHEEFWKHRGDKVPHYYSRHASVHGVSSRQFSKRNCVQVLMLVTSLISYADRIAREAA